jgi:beta-lactamase regulating signal transducer with metallopeptidase domain
MLLLPALTFRVLSVAPASAPSSSGVISLVAQVATDAATTRSSVPAVVSLDRRIESLLPGLVALWGAGVLLLCLRSVGGMALVRRLGRSGLSAAPAALEATLARLANTLGLRASVRLYESALVGVPTVVGWLRPVILLPASTLTGLTAQQLELILAHELAHIRRHDYLVNLVQSAAETLLFYHPAVWWVSKRMRVEREHCAGRPHRPACGSARFTTRARPSRGLCSDAPALGDG